MKIKIILTLLCVLFISCNREVKLDGEVFVVTKGAENIKLGGVSVLVIPENLAKGYVETKKPEFDRQLKDLNKTYRDLHKQS